MTRSEYQDLVEFLGTRFDAIDRRFDAIESRLARVEVSGEENRHHIQILAERIEALEQKMDREFRAVRAEMADGFRTQGLMINALETRMGRWEGKSA